MTDLDRALRALGDDLRTDPTLAPTEIRRLGTRRRARRRLAVGGSALAAAAIAVAVAMNGVGAPVANPPAGSTSPSDSASVPVAYRQVHDAPKVFANAPGGSGLAGVAGTVEAYAAADPVSGCLVLSSVQTPTSDPERTPPRALAFPVGSTWVDRPAPGVKLTDGRVVTVGAKLVLSVSVTERTDPGMSSVCRGTSGVAAIPTPADIRSIDGQTVSSSSSSTPAAAWVRSIVDFPLGQGLSSAGDQTLGPITHDVRHPGGIEPCMKLANIPSVDGIEMTLDSPAEHLVRQLRLFADDTAAKENVTAWLDAVAGCQGKTVSGPPDLTPTYTVMDLGTDTYVIVLVARSAQGDLSPWMGVMGVRRVGNAVLTTSSTSEAMATPDNIDQAKVATQEWLGVLGTFMCRYAPGARDSC